MDRMRWLALALALVPACNLKFNSTICGAADNQWICAEGLGCADPPTYCGKPVVDQCAELADFTPCSLASGDGVCLSHVCGPCSLATAGCKTGGTWQVMTSGTTQALRSLWVASDSDVYAVGDMATLLHYDGHGWTALDSSAFGTTDLLSIWGADDDQLFVVGAQTAYRLVAGVWTGDLMPPAIFLNGVWGSAADNVVVVGSDGAIYRFDGTSWNREGLGVTAATLSAIWGTDADHIWAVGSALGTSSTVLSFDTGVWKQPTVGTPDPHQQLHAVGGSGPDDIYAVGDPASGLVTMIEDQAGSWQPLDEMNLPSEALLAVWARGPGDFLIGGEGGLLIEGEGTTWTTFSTTGATINAIMGSSGDSVFAVGDGGLILHYTPD
jgi:hypothetical protein